MSTEGASEAVPVGVVIWQSDRAKTYRCPTCLRWVFSQYEGDALPQILCYPGWHQLIWDREWEPKA